MTTRKEKKERCGFLKGMKRKERKGKGIKIIDVVVFSNLIREKEG